MSPKVKKKLKKQNKNKNHKQIQTTDWKDMKTSVLNQSKNVTECKRQHFRGKKVPKERVQ